MTPPLIQGTRVQVRLTATQFVRGQIVGLATLQYPVTGYTYIIQPDDDNAIRVYGSYPYTHFVASALTVLES